MKREQGAACTLGASRCADRISSKIRTPSPNFARLEIVNELLCISPWLTNFRAGKKWNRSEFQLARRKSTSNLVSALFITGASIFRVSRSKRHRHVPSPPSFRSNILQFTRRRIQWSTARALPRNVNDKSVAIARNCRLEWHRAIPSGRSTASHLATVSRGSNGIREWQPSVIWPATPGEMSLRVSQRLKLS